jgi:ribosomal-protein-alanine N-acetyltransferase
MIGAWSFLGYWCLGFGVSDARCAWDVELWSVPTPLKLKTANLTIIPHIPAHLVALSRSKREYEKISGFKAAPGIRDFLLMASPEFLRSLETASAPDPWKFGFAIFHTADDRVIGLCGFAGPPNAEGSVEIGYSIAPVYRGKGHATEVAEALVAFAAEAGGVRQVCAHTLAETNASIRVLEKCGFTKTNEITDPEGKLGWRWEKRLMPNDG